MAPFTDRDLYFDHGGSGPYGSPMASQDLRLWRLSWPRLGQDSTGRHYVLPTLPDVRPLHYGAEIATRPAVINRVHSSWGTVYATFVTGVEKGRDGSTFYGRTGTAIFVLSSHLNDDKLYN